jgi:hypothetical protein
MELVMFIQNFKRQQIRIVVFICLIAGPKTTGDMKGLNFYFEEEKKLS